MLCVTSELPDFAYILPSSFNSGPPRDKWISDSGAGTHICNNHHSFSTFMLTTLKLVELVNHSQHSH